MIKIYLNIINLEASSYKFEQEKKEEINSEDNQEIKINH